MESNARLNLKGGPETTYEVGQHVIAYVVPTRSTGPDKVDEKKTSKWKRKHKICWRGPCVVRKQLSATYYEVEEIKTGIALHPKRSLTRALAWRHPRGARASESRRPTPWLANLWSPWTT